MHKSPVVWDALKAVEVDHLLTPGQPFSQTPDDLLHGTLVMSPTGGGKTESIINHALHYLVRLQETMGVGGLVIDPVGGNEDGFTGSLNLEAFCDGGVFAADKGTASARFNPLRSGGAQFGPSLYRKDELVASGDANYYTLYGLRHVSSFTDLLLWVEAFIARGDVSIPYPGALQRASVNTLMSLLTMNGSGEDAAQAIDALLAHAKKRKVSLPNTLDLDVFFNHLRACKTASTRREHVRSLTGAVNRLFYLRAAYQSQGCDLLDDDPQAKAIDIAKAVEGGKIVGLRLPVTDGFPRIQLARCALRLYTDQVLKQRRPAISTMLVLDEAPVFIDETMSEFLAQARKSGAAAILAFQTREQFSQSEGLLTELWHNAKNHWIIPPLSPEEALYFENIMGSLRYSRFEKSVSYTTAPRDQQHPSLLRWLLGDRHTYTGHSISEKENEEPLYDRHFLSYAQHQAVFRGLTHSELKTGVVKLSPIQPPASRRVIQPKGGGPSSTAREVSG